MAHIPGIAATRREVVGGIVDASFNLPSGVDFTHETGIQFRSEGCGEAYIQYCDGVTGPYLGPHRQDSSEFKPFMIVYPEHCSSIVGLDDDGRTVRGLETKTSGMIAAEISAYHAGPAPNPTLPNLATDSSPITLNGLAETLAGLIEDMANCGYRGAITFHLPSRVLPIALKENLILGVEGLNGDGNKRYRMGHHILSFDSYSDVGPVGQAASPGGAWIYATGPVELGISEIRNEPVGRERLRDLQNEVVFQAYQMALYRFDECCVFAAEASVC